LVNAEMDGLTDYLDVETLRQFASSLAAAAEAEVRILGANGQVLVGAERPVRVGPRVSIVVDGQSLGAIELGAGADHTRALRLLGLARDALGRLCQQARDLRDRVEELQAVYRLTEVFTGVTDLGQVHQLVAETMVRATGADACSIRVLSADRTELLVMGVYGLSDEYMSKGPIRLADSRIDQEVVSTGRCVYIADERTDPRVLYPAEAKREGIVSALCAPMSYRGKVEGVIRVYTKRPHEFDWYETSLIRGVAAQAASAVVNARLYREALEGEAMRRQLRLAGEVQRRMIPARPPQVPGVDIAAVYEPCFELAGDFYDFIELPGGNLGVCVADAVGKGVRASLLMASARAALRAHVTHTYQLSLALASVNVTMWRETEEGDFLTMFYGVLDVANRRLTYCNAGHEPALLIRAGQVHALTGGGGVIGIDPNMPYEHEVVQLESGDLLLLYTDGLPEAMNFRDEPFGRERLREAAVQAARATSAEAAGRIVLWTMRRFVGLRTPLDDLTLLTLRVQ